MRNRGMKRLLTLLLSLALVLSLFPLPALGSGSEVYDLWIAGVQVTDENRSDVLGDGVFSYNKRTNTLTVDGYCNYPSDYVIRSEISGLTIESAWDSTLIGDRGCVSLQRSTTITGEKLTIKNTGTNWTALSVRGTLTIRDTELVVDGAGRAISGGTDVNTALEIIDSTVSAKTASTSGQVGAVMSFKGGISFEGCEITEPEDAYVSLGSICVPGGSLPKEVRIEKPTGRATVRVGDYLQLGSYYNAPILWRCVSVDENGPLMLADQILCLKAYDARTSVSVGHHARDPLGDVAQWGSNTWAYSNIRSWLNSASSNVDWKCGNPPTASYVGGGLNAYVTAPGFLTGFTALELSAVKSVKQKCVVAANDSHTEGGEPYVPGPTEPSSPVALASLEGILGNYANAYATWNTDRMFLLDVAQLYAVYENGATLGYDYHIGKVSEQAAEYSEYVSEGVYAQAAWKYWLRTPVTDTGASVYAMYPDGTIISEGQDGHAFDSEYGIRPAFYLDAVAAVGQGRGTADSPYVVFEEPEVEPTPTPRPTPAPELTVTATKTELMVGESATLTVTAANIDPSYKLEWSVQQSRLVVNLLPYRGAKANLSARTPGTALVTAQATVQGRIVAQKTVTVTVQPPPPTPPTPTPTPEPKADFSSVSLGNGELYLYKGKDYLQSLSIITDTGDRYFDRDYVDHVYYNSNYPIQVKTYKLSGWTLVESDEIVSAGTAWRVEGYDYVWVRGNAVGRGAVEVTMPNSNGTLCTCRRYVTVTDPSAGVSSFSISIPKDVKYYPNSTAQLSLSVQPAGALYKSLTYTSLDPDVATVDQNGRITCKAPGQALIMAELHNYGANSRYKYAYRLIQVYSTADYCDSYGYAFSNNKGSFGYSSGYEIPQSIYMAAGMGRLRAWLYSCKDWNGSCVGMSVTSQLFYLGKLDSGFYSNRDDGAWAYLPHDLKAPNTESEQDQTLRRMIELFHVSQDIWYDKTYITSASGSGYFKTDRLRYMADSVKRGEPVVISMRDSWNYVGGSGHAVLLCGYEYGPGEKYTFDIYDPSGFVDTLVFYKQNGDWVHWFHYLNHDYDWYPHAYYTLSSITKGYNYLRDHTGAVYNGARYAYLLDEEEDAHEAVFGTELTVTLPEGDYTLADADGRTMTVTGGTLSGELEGVRLTSEIQLDEAAEYTLTLPLGDYALTGSGAGTASYTVCDDVNAAELTVPADATVHFSSALTRLGVSKDAPFAYSIRFVAFDNAYDYLELSGTAASRVDAVLSGWEAEVVGSDTLRARVTVCGSEVERSIGNLSGEAVTVKISDERALGLWMGGEPVTEETPLSERMDAIMPNCDLPGGEYDSPRTLRLEGADDETVIHYTTDGSMPTEDSPVYVLPIPVCRSMTLRAVASKFGYRDSEVLSLEYTFPELAAPTADTLGGHYVETLTVRLSGEQTVLYTLDGSDPALYGTVCTQRIVIGGDTVLRAVCVDENGVASEELCEEYTFTRLWPADAAYLLTDGNGEPTQELAGARNVTFTLTSYAELEAGSVFLASYDGNGKCLGISRASVDLWHRTDSATLPLPTGADVAAVKAFFCDEYLVPIAETVLLS